MLTKEIAWRGFVTQDLELIVWPTLLAQHNDFLAMFGRDESKYRARWRQWSVGGEVDFDPGADPEAVRAVLDALGVLA
jgi:hypothetical protein